MKLTFKLDTVSGPVKVYHEICVEFDEDAQGIHLTAPDDVDDLEGIDVPSGGKKGDERKRGYLTTRGTDVSYMCEGLVLKAVKLFYESAGQVQASGVETES